MKLIFSISLLLVCSLCLSQQSYTARVVDGVSNEAIQDANIIVVGSNQGTSTDENGYFELNLKLFPSNISISHLGYEVEKRTIRNIDDREEVIYLYPKMDVLKEITITAENQVVPLSEVEVYSVSDFEITNNRIYRLEYHDIFQKYKLSITDLDGSLQQVISLKELKGVHSLFQSCNAVIYILSNNHAYALKMKDYEYVIDKKIMIDEFHRNVAPCKLRLENKLYFIKERSNGLVSQVTSYNFDTEEHVLLATVAEKELLENFRRDFMMMNRGQEKISATVSRVSDNDRIRKLQKESDFYLNIFYKPEFPVNISSSGRKIMVYNHVEGKIECYENNNLVGEVEIAYPTDKKWLKELRVDKISEKVYGTFNLSTGIGLKEVDLHTGKVKLVGIVETSLQHHKRIEVFNNSIYYLRSKLLDGSNMELCKFDF